MSDTDVDGYYEMSLEELKPELEERSLLDLYTGEEAEGIDVPYKDGEIDPDRYLQRVIEIQFDEKYGAPFWREMYEEELDFDPREEIESFEDLEKLPEADEDALRERPVRDFMPRLFHDGDVPDGASYDDIEPDPGYFHMSRSSGTTGKQKKMPFRKTVSHELTEWYNHRLDEKGTGDGNWLINGPYGLFEKLMEETVEARGGIPHFVGIETKRFKHQAGALEDFAAASLLGKAKKAVTEPGDVVRALKGVARMEPTMEVLENDLKSEPVENLAGTGAVVEQLYRTFDLEDSVSDPEDVDTILLGLATTEEEMEELEELYPNSDIISMYATSFTGAAFDTDGTEDITYYHVSPLVDFEVLEEGVDSFEEREPVGYGERGQVMFHRVGEGFFWPNQTERESAVRARPVYGGGDGLREIEPLED